MARNVYFDPYGSYAEGYDLGTQREVGLQDALRNARQTDLDYEFNRYADPFRRRAVDVGSQRQENALFQENLGLAEVPARVYGITNPFRNMLQRRFGISERQGGGNPAALEQYGTQLRQFNLTNTAREEALGQLEADLAQLPVEQYSPEFAQALEQSVLQNTARKYGIPIEALMQPMAAPQAPSTNTGTEYLIDGQVVSRMPNARENELGYINRVDDAAAIAREYGYFDDALGRRNQDFYRQMQQFYINRALQGGNGRGTTVADEALEGFE